MSRRFICTTLAALTMIALQPSHADAGYKGYAVTRQTLRARLMKPSSAFDLIGYLNAAGSTDRGLLELLGTYSDGQLINSEPGVIGTLLWHVTLRGFSQDVGRICASGGTGPGQPVTRSDEFDPAFLDSTRALCSWPSASSRSDTALLNYWLSLIAFDAPMAEYEAWRQFLTSGAWDHLSPDALVEMATTTALMNPWFLLE